MLPFGLTTSPHFYKGNANLGSSFKVLGLNLTSYIDDLQVNHFSKETLERQVNEIFIPVMLQAGFILDPKKGNPFPSQKTKLLGLEVDLLNEKIFIPEDKKRKIISNIKSLLRTLNPKAKQLARVAGIVISVLRAAPVVRIFLKALYSLLREVNSSPAAWDSTMEITSLVRENLEWLIQNLDLLEGAPIWRPPEIFTLTTDASDSAMGGFLYIPSLDLSFDCHINLLVEERNLPIHVREAKAVLYSLVQLQKYLQNSWLKIVIDNQAVRFSLWNGSRDPNFRR